LLTIHQNNKPYHYSRAPKIRRASLQALSESDLKTDAKTIAGTAILGTLVLVFDCPLKLSQK